MKEYKPLEKVKENPALKKEYMKMKPIDSKKLKGQSYERAKGIMQKAMTNRSKKSKMMEEGADYWLKKDREQLGY
jgi:hypothetical protein